MSTPDFPLHPESVPPRIAYTPGHRQWLDENRVKLRHRDLLESIMSYKMWWNVIKVLAIPAAAACIVALIITNIMAPNVTLTFALKCYLIGGSIASCVVTSVYVDNWAASVKTRSDWYLIRSLGTISGALIGLTSILISLIPN